MRHPTAALAMSLVMWPVRAHATAVPPELSGLVCDAIAARRTEFIQGRLDQGTASAQWWWYGWLVGYSASALAQGAIGIATRDEALRATMLVGAAGAALGALSVVAFPFPPAHSASELRASEGATVQERYSFALRSLKANADAERLGRSWLPHALGAAVAAAQGLVLWVGFHQPVDGAESAALSLVIAEAQIFTQPMRAMDDLAEYQRQFPRPNQSALRWHLAPAPRGLGLLLQW